MKNLEENQIDTMDLDSIVTMIEDIAILIGRKDGLITARDYLFTLSYKFFKNSKDEAATALRNAAVIIEEQFISREDENYSRFADDRTELWDALDDFERKEQY